MRNIVPNHFVRFTETLLTNELCHLSVNSTFEYQMNRPARNELFALFLH